MKESQLYSFIDKQSAFTIHFLQGGKLMSDIVTTHNIGPTALEFYRDAILSSMQMLNYMKATENMGFYIDSEEPYFRFKVEMNAQGTMRTLLLPEEFEEFPKEITGNARVTKAFPNKQPYSSIIKIEKNSPNEVVNKVFKESYQTASETQVGYSDCSLMFSKLPPSNLSKKFDEIVDRPLSEFVKEHKDLIKELDKNLLEDEKDIISFFESKELTYLGSKQVKFHCPCSKERMVANLMTLSQNDIDSVFEEKESVEVRCDYCNTIYDINEKDLKAQ